MNLKNLKEKCTQVQSDTFLQIKILIPVLLLRTALIKNNKFYIQSGAGIVADSIPEKEYLGNSA